MSISLLFYNPQYCLATELLKEEWQFEVSSKVQFSSDEHVGSIEYVNLECRGYRLGGDLPVERLPKTGGKVEFLRAVRSDYFKRDSCSEANSQSKHKKLRSFVTLSESETNFQVVHRKILVERKDFAKTDAQPCRAESMPMGRVKHEDAMIVRMDWNLPRKTTTVGKYVIDELIQTQAQGVIKRVQSIYSLASVFGCIAMIGIVALCHIAKVGAIFKLVLVPFFFANLVVLYRSFQARLLSGQIHLITSGHLVAYFRKWAYRYPTLIHTSPEIKRYLLKDDLPKILKA